MAVFNGVSRSIVPLEWSGLELADFVVNWESTLVARNASFSWQDIAGVFDVTVSLDTRAYGVLATTNGMVAEPRSVLLVGIGILLLIGWSRTTRAAHYRRAGSAKRL